MLKIRQVDYFQTYFNFLKQLIRAKASGHTIRHTTGHTIKTIKFRAADQEIYSILII